ncbi:MAG: hypothetical protein K2X94_01760 [Amoebophilaceae bacterium]|nr:hypothetical protein [Amoebophilaceae bacterium]
MQDICDTNSIIALLLIPTFLGLYFCFYYAKEGLQGQSIQSLVINILSKGMCLIGFICYFEEIMGLLDRMVVGIMDLWKINEQISVYLTETKDALTEASSVWYTYGIDMIPSHYHAIKKVSLGVVQLFVRGVLHAFRGYLLVFSTQLGPLAVAMAALPGRYAGVAAHWFSLQISFFIWGLTLSLMDVMLAKLKFLTIIIDNPSMMELAALAALMLMYVVVSTATALYIGGVVGRPIFNATGNFFTNQLISGGNKLYKF